MTLLELQSTFQEYLLGRNHSIQNEVLSSKAVSSQERLNIYNNAYQYRLYDALSANYPILQKFLKYKKFIELTTDYVKHYPSESPSIRWYGNQLSGFLSEHSNYKNKSYLSELAAWEWAYTLAFDSKDDLVLNIEHMTTIPPEAWAMMQFKLHSSVRRLNLYWNVVDLWEQLCQNRMAPKIQSYKQSIPWILWRKEFHEHYCQLTMDEAWVIDAMLNQQSFSDICEGLCQWFEPEEAAIRGASLLKSWLNEGLISTIILK